MLTLKVNRRTVEIADVTYHAAVSHYLDDIADRLQRGEEVHLLRIGKLQVVPTAPGRFRNPQTGDIITKPPGHKLKLRAARRWRTYDR